jgi:hypothetical protein
MRPRRLLTDPEGPPLAPLVSPHRPDSPKRLRPKCSRHCEYVSIGPTASEGTDSP